MTHRIPLPGTRWTLWRYALLRTAGFPADGLHRFAAPDCAAVADALLDGHCTPEKFAAAYGEAAERTRIVARELAADPLFREAVTWQNRTAVHALDGLLRESGRRWRQRDRQREHAVARYWQRYCGKNETIGFFGPTCWVDIEPEGALLTVHTGGSLTRERRVFLEHWALVAFAEALAADPLVGPWLPVRRAPHVWFAGGRLYRPTGPPRLLPATEAAVFAACDGRPARLVVEAVAAEPASGLRKAADVRLVLDRLVAGGLVVHGIGPPPRLDAPEVLQAAIAAIPDGAARGHAEAAWARLATARDRVAGAAGDADGLRTALDRLDAEFTEVTGRDAYRRSGQTYAGRVLCYEETTRDLDVTVGGAVLGTVAAPLEILLRAARWLTGALADAYSTALAELVGESTVDGSMPLGELWYLAQGLLFGGGRRPVDAVAAEFTRHWSVLFGLDALAPGTPEIAVSSTDLAPVVARVFGDDRPGWGAARVHSPDLHICATDAEAVRRGDFTVVLGEMHAAWPTFDCAVFLWPRKDVGDLRDALRADAGDGRVLPLFPPDWPRQSGRLSRGLDNDSDVLLAFAPTSGADPVRSLPISAVTVSLVDGRPVARAADGRSWPLIEVFAGLVAMHAVDGFKLVAPTAHTPRISIDRLVVARETWRTTVGATPLATTGPEQRYLATRRWRRELGLPERGYVKLGTETKPCYVDLTSPAYLGALATMVRGATRTGGPGVPLVFTEMLPTPEQAWVPDAAGRRYFSELRLHVVDPMTAGGRA